MIGWLGRPTSAHIGGPVFLRNASFQDVNLVEADIAGDVEASNSTFHKELSLDDTKVRGSVFLYILRFTILISSAPTLAVVLC